MQVGGDNLNLELGMVEAQVAGGEDPAAGTPPETSTVKALRGVGFLTLVISVGTLCLQAYSWSCQFSSVIFKFSS